MSLRDISADHVSRYRTIFDGDRYWFPTSQLCCGGRNCTCDLKVMHTATAFAASDDTSEFVVWTNLSLASYYCSTPLGEIYYNLTPLQCLN